jgi:hypothetical protein
MEKKHCEICWQWAKEGSWYCDYHSEKIAYYARLEPPESRRKDRIEGTEDGRRTFGANRKRKIEHEWCQRCGMAAKIGTGSCPLC